MSIKSNLRKLIITISILLNLLSIGLLFFAGDYSKPLIALILIASCLMCLFFVIEKKSSDKSLSELTSKISESVAMLSVTLRDKINIKTEAKPIPQGNVEETETGDVFLLQEILYKIKSLTENVNNFENVEVKESFKKIDPEIVSSMKFYKIVIDALLKSIINNISSTTVPISKELLLIKDNISEFVRDTKENDEEINKRSNFNLIIETNNLMNDEFGNMYQRIRESYSGLEASFSRINSIIEKIHTSSLEIQNIAEKINVLSINAAIEAARSGENGKGFKVISGEIKKLSDHTQAFVRDISSTVNESRNIVTKASENFSTDEKIIIDSVSKQKDKFNDFYSLLSGYYKKFITIYDAILKLTANISGSITKINPVVLLHEITVQEIENIDLAIADYFENGIESLSALYADDKFVLDKVLLEKITYKIRERLTTSHELDALNSAVSQTGVELNFDLKRDNKDIEFF